MFGLGPWELIIILAIVLVVFGPSRLKNLGSDLGGAIKGFRTAVKDDPAEKVEDQVKADTANAEKAVDSADQKTNV